MDRFGYTVHIQFVIFERVMTPGAPGYFRCIPDK